MLNSKNTQFIILSCDSYLDSRVKCIRETWGNSVNRIFLVDSDFIEYQDLIGFNTPRNYEGIQEKYIQFFKNYSFEKFEYFFFVDDDTFVVTNNIKNQNVPPSDEPFCICRHLHLSENGMDKWGNNTHYPLWTIGGIDSNLPLDYASGGSGFVLSKSACLKIKGYLNTIQQNEIPRSSHGDVSIGFWMRACGIKLIHSNNLWWSTPENLIDNTWEVYKEDGTALTFHYVSEERMYELNNTYNNTSN